MTQTSHEYTFVIDTTVIVNQTMANEVAAWMRGEKAPSSPAEFWCVDNFEGKVARVIASSEGSHHAIAIPIKDRPTPKILQGIKTRANFCPVLRTRIRSFRLLKQTVRVSMTEEIV